MLYQDSVMHKSTIRIRESGDFTTDVRKQSQSPEPSTILPTERIKQNSAYQEKFAKLPSSMSPRVDFSSIVLKGKPQAAAQRAKHVAKRSAVDSETGSIARMLND